MNKLSRSAAGLIVALAAARAQVPASAPAFEVATIKPSEPLSAASVISGQLHVGMKVDGARVDIGYLPLSTLLTMAFRVKPYQISGPSWMSDQRFDILAKIPEGGSTDQVPEMLQALLAERFGLKYHRETKEHEMYALVVGKNGPKLKESPPEAEPAAAESAAANAGASADKSAEGGRGGMTISAGDQNLRVTPNPAARGMTVSGGRNGRINMTMGTDGTMRLEVAKMTMEELAGALTSFVDHPVEDRTGLKGNYQVTLDFSMGDLLNAARAAGLAVPPGALGTASGAASAAAPADAASTPGDTSVFAAIQQLGLRLEPRKDQVDVVVIDHLEKTPTEN